MAERTVAVDLLCRVVDNYGDIGVVYRLAKALSAIRPELELRLLVDNLEAFSAMCPAVRPGRPVQRLGGWTIIAWDVPWEGVRQRRPRRVVEAFACGRPDWYDAILHDPDDPAPRQHLVLEYLSAEPYAEEFHLLPSLSPIPQVKKVFFMPGFNRGTGGLVFDAGFMAEKRARRQLGPDGRAALLDRARAAVWDGAAACPLALPAPAEIGDRFWFCLFSYEHDYRALVADLAAWQAETGRGVLVLVAAGRSEPAFRAAWEAAGRPFGAAFLPFLDQEAWDALLLASDCAVIRGEESLARAALGGRPFVWHAYLQDDGYQRVKAAALIDTVEYCLAPSGAPGAPAAADPEPSPGQAWRRLMESFNERTVNSAERPAADPWLGFLRALPELEPGFRRFAEKLEKQGDCAQNLLSLMDDFS